MSAPTVPTINPAVVADDRLRDIDLIGQRINAIVRFMCDMGNLAGTSAESRDQALTAFHQKLIAVEKQLAHIQEKLRLE